MIKGMGLLALLTLLSFGQAGPALADTFLAFGDLRGYVEPCGCDPETDLGGLGRLYQYIYEQRQLIPNGLILDLGHNFGHDWQDSKTGQRKAKTIVAGLAAIAPSASLVTSDRIAYARAYGHPAPNRWLLSNGTAGKSGKAGWKTMIETEGFLILGVVDPKGPRTNTGKKNSVRSSYQKVDKRLFANLRKLTAVHKARLKSGKKRLVILYDGKDSGLNLLKDAFPAARFVRTNRQPITALADQKERQQPGMLFHEGVYSVPSFGQGVLSQGRFQAAPLDLSKPSGSPLPKGLPGMDLGKPNTSGIVLPKSPFVWLSKNYTLSHRGPMTPVLAEYQSAAKGAFQAAAAKKLEARKNQPSPYAGAKACLSCHPEAYKVYASSAHAKAIDTLIKKKHQHNGECVKCHVVGFDKPGGYIDQKHTPELAGVQCETCHGPRKSHTLNPKVGPQAKATNLVAAKAACASCHHPPHSSAFDYASYWLKIKHK